jgi:hypothetical protein
VTDPDHTQTSDDLPWTEPAVDAKCSTCIVHYLELLTIQIQAIQRGFLIYKPSGVILVHLFCKACFMI